MNKKILLILSILLFTNAIFPPQTAYARPDIYEEIAAYLQSGAKSAHIPALSVTIVDKNSILFSQTYGDCKNSDTPFYLGSVSKSFTAVCAMQLSERGKIDLNSTISAYLPDATDGDKITVKQLLNHTSGLGEHQTLANYRIVNEQGVHHYANVNYTLLGKIIESASGESYSDYITENLIKPLNLTHTAATQNESESNGVIEGHTNYWGFPIKRPHKYPQTENAWITVPAGYISSSTNDLGKYLQMYLNGGSGIITEQSIETMFYGDTAYIDGDIPYWYGYGWTLTKEPLPEPVLRHSGLIETGTSCIFILPERETGIAVTANTNGYFVSNELLDRLGWGIVLKLLGESVDEFRSGTYILSHIRINLIMLAVLIISILPLCRISKYKAKHSKSRLPVLSLILIHAILPVFILLVIPIYFETPLWVARAFVPDVFITVIISSALLFTGGIIKSAILFAKNINQNAQGRNR